MSDSRPSTPLNIAGWMACAGRVVLFATVFSALTVFGLIKWDDYRRQQGEKEALPFATPRAWEAIPLEAPWVAIVTTKLETYTLLIKVEIKEAVYDNVRVTNKDDKILITDSLHGRINFSKYGSIDLTFLDKDGFIIDKKTIFTNEIATNTQKVNDNTIINTYYWQGQASISLDNYKKVSRISAIWRGVEFIEPIAETGKK